MPVPPANRSVSVSLVFVLVAEAWQFGVAVFGRVPEKVSGFVVGKQSSTKLRLIEGSTLDYARRRSFISRLVPLDFVP